MARTSTRQPRRTPFDAPAAALLALTLLLVWLGGSAGFAQGAIRFSHDLDATLEQAKATDTPVVLMFSAAWCPHCRAMRRNTLPSPQVQALAPEFLWVDIDIDRQLSLARDYQVEGTPSIYLLDASGEQRARLVGQVAPADLARQLQGFVDLLGRSPRAAVGATVEETRYDSSRVIWRPKGYRGQSICFSHVGYGPLTVPSQSPFQSLRLALVPRTPSTLVRGQWEARGGVTWVNVWANDDEVFDPETEEYGQYFLDYETLSTEVALSYGISDTVELELQFDRRSRFGGSMDGFVQGFHDLFGLDQSGRELVPKDDFHFFLDPPDGALVQVDAAERGAYSRDVLLSVQHNVTCGTQRLPAFSYALTVRHTDNDDLEGDDLDFGLSVAAARRFGNVYTYLTLGFGAYGDDFFRGIELEGTQFSALLAAEWRFRPKMSLIFQYLFSEASVAGDFGPFSEPSNEIVLGGKWEVRKLGVLEIGLIENVVTFDNSPDAGLHVAFTQRF